MSLPSAHLSNLIPNESPSSPVCRLLLGLAVHVLLYEYFDEINGTQDEGGGWTLNRAATVDVIRSLRHTCAQVNSDTRHLLASLGLLASCRGCRAGKCVKSRVPPSVYKHDDDQLISSPSALRDGEMFQTSSPVAASASCCW